MDQRPVHYFPLSPQDFLHFVVGKAAELCESDAVSKGPIKLPQLFKRHVSDEVKPYCLAVHLELVVRRGLKCTWSICKTLTNTWARKQ